MSLFQLRKFRMKCGVGSVYSENKSTKGRFNNLRVIKVKVVIRLVPL